MTVHTVLDENEFYHALWIQNELYSRKMLIWLRAILILIVIASSMSLHLVDDRRGWFVCALVCCVVVGVHAIVSKQMRVKMLRGTAQNIREAHGGPLAMEYRFEEDKCVAVSPTETTEFEYSKVAALAEDTEVFVIVLSKMYLHAIRKSDLSGEARHSLAVMLGEKTGKPWRAVKM